MRNYRNILWGLGAVLAIAATLTAAAAPGCSSCVGGGSGGTWS